MPAVRLSVACLTGDPPSRLAAVLAPVRELADEVVLGVDSRAFDGSESAYRDLGDRTVRIGFDWRRFDALLEELHAGCRGDWVLRLDGDEVLSARLLDALPSLMAREDVRQWSFPRQWLSEDGAGWIPELPWWPDWQTRLVRRGVRFEGGVHAAPVLDQPRLLHPDPIIHLDALLSPRRRRAAKAARYERIQPGGTAPGGLPVSAYYEPERHRTVPALPLPSAEAPSVTAVLAASGWPGQVASGTLAGPPAGAAPEARLEFVDRDLRFRAGERRSVAVVAHNTSCDTWAASGAPPYRLGSRWFGADGQVIEGSRCGFSLAVPTDDSLTTMLELSAPDEPGQWELVVDLLHDERGWLGANVRATAYVRPSAPSRGRGWRSLRPAR